MTPEGKVKQQVKKLLARYKPRLWCHWPVQTGYGAPTLDCTGAINGYAFAIETKAPGESLTPRQLLTQTEMEAAGIRVFVVGFDAWGGDGPHQLVYAGMRELEEWLTQHS